MDKITDGDRAVVDIIARLDALDAVQLAQLIQAAQERRRAKLQQAREAFIARVRAEAAALDLKPEEVFGRATPARKPASGARRRGKVAAQFRGPDGQTWSGRGRPPVWLANLEKQGRSREEFRIREGQPDLIEQATREHAAT